MSPPEPPDAGPPDGEGSSAAVRVRFARIPEDLEPVLALGEEAYREGHRTTAPFDAEKVTVLARRMTGSPRSVVFIARRGHEDVGIIGGNVGQHMFTQAVLATVVAVYVRPSARNGLAAVKLLHAFRKWAAAKGACEMHVSITSGMRIKTTDRLLRRLGFEPTGGNYAVRLTK